MIGSPFMSVKAVWAGLKQSTRVPCAVDCAPQQTKSGADSSTAVAASTLLPEDDCSQSLRFSAVVQSPVNWACGLPLVHPWKYPKYCFWGASEHFRFQKKHSLWVVKSAVLTPFPRDAQKTHSRGVHLDSWQSRPVRFEVQWGETVRRS